MNIGVLLWNQYLDLPSDDVRTLQEWIKLKYDPQVLDKLTYPTQKLLIQYLNPENSLAKLVINHFNRVSYPLMIKEYTHVYYLTNGQTRVYLLGDAHLHQHTCLNGISIYKFLRHLADNTDQFLQIFIEIDYLSRDQPRSITLDIETDYIRQCLQPDKSICPYKTTQFHYVDIRKATLRENNQYMSLYQHISLWYSLYYLWILNPESNQPSYVLENTLNQIVYYMRKNRDFLYNLRTSEYKRVMTEYIPRDLIDKQLRTLPDIYQTYLSKYMNDQLNNTLVNDQYIFRPLYDKFFDILRLSRRNLHVDMKRVIKQAMNSIPIDGLMRIPMISMDVYCIARFLRFNQTSFIITGREHTFNYVDILQDLGWYIMDERQSSLTENCINLEGIPLMYV